MKTLILLVALLATSYGQTNNLIVHTQPGASLEHFTLSGRRAYDGIWDATKSQIHVVIKSNHVANAQVQSSDLVSRRKIGDGSDIPIFSDIDIAEKVLLLNLQNYKAAQTRLARAQQAHDTLHATYGHKTLPQTQYNAVMLQYKATDDELANAQKAVDAAAQGFAKAQEAYSKAGGKKQYSL